MEVSVKAASVLYTGTAVLLASFLTACERPGKFPLGSDKGVFEGSHLRAYLPAQQIRQGTIYRVPRFPGSDLLSPLIKDSCPKDITRINPTSIQETVGKVEISGTVEEVWKYVVIDMPDAAFPVINYISNVRLELKDPVIITLEENESDRIFRNLWPGCQEGLKKRLKEEQYIFLAERVVIARKAKITVTYKPSIRQSSKIDIKKTRANGLKAQTVTEFQSIHVGENVVVEVKPRKIVLENDRIMFEKED
jgi:hypothetical protein